METDHTWPAAVRAADFLQREYSRPWHVDALAKAAGASRASLNRSFHDVYGMSSHQYLTRVRIRHAISQLREPGSFVDAVAFSVGYQSVKDLYLGVGRLTGLTLARARALDDAAFHDVLETSLAIPAPRRREGVKFEER